MECAKGKGVVLVDHGGELANRGGQSVALHPPLKGLYVFDFYDVESKLVERCRYCGSVVVWSHGESS